MESWTYNELKKSVENDLEELEKNVELKYSSGQVAGRCFYENTVVISEGYTEKIIVYVTIGKFIVQKCSEKSIRNYNEKLKVEFEKYNRKLLDDSLTEKEIDELEENIEFILSKIYV